MDRFSRGFAALLLLISLSAASAESEDEARELVARSKERCDDFYRYRRQSEESGALREKGAQEVKKFRAAHDEEIEAARKQYVKSRKVSIPDPRLEKNWEEENKGWIEHNKLEGRRYAEGKARAAAIERKGCHVPEMQEYDLED